SSLCVLPLTPPSFPTRRASDLAASSSSISWPGKSTSIPKAAASTLPRTSGKWCAAAAASSWKSGACCAATAAMSGVSSPSPGPRLPHVLVAGGEHRRREGRDPFTVQAQGVPWNLVEDEAPVAGFRAQEKPARVPQHVQGHGHLHLVPAHPARDVPDPTVPFALGSHVHRPRGPHLHVQPVAGTGKIGSAS